jgi:Cu/Ag efflux pump CusA
MLTWLISTSIRLRVVLIALCVVLLVVGIRAVEHVPLDVFPDAT